MLCRNASLTEVPSDVPKMTVSLDLSCNAISELRNTSFSSDGMGHLISLYIYKNIIRTINIGAFRNLRVLKSLFMGQNKLTYMHPDTFIHNTELEELDLHGNNISLRDRGPFHHLTNLRALNIADCNLRHISKETFRKTVKLTRLDISNNKLTYIENHLFDYLNSLKFLNLSRNLLRSLDFLLTISETNLQEIILYVSNNKLGNLSNDVLKRMCYLKNLDIHDNPLSCRRWDKNLLLHVSQPCYEYSDKLETYMGNCLNKTTRVSATEVIPRETRSTEISVSEIIDYETLEPQRTIASKNLSDFNVINDDLNIVTDAPVLQESSETFSETEKIIMIVALSLTLVVLVSVIGVCFCPKISKSKLSVSAECDTIPEEGNYQQGRQCEVCRIYQNYTPTCNHTVSKQNKKTSNRGNLNFANQSSLETYTYELILREDHEDCYLYEPANERDYKNSNSDSEQNSLMPFLVAHDELGTDTTANRTHPTCTLVNHEDTVSECKSDTSECERRMLKFPRHSCHRVISYVACPSDVNISGRNRHLWLDSPSFLQSRGTSWHPTLEQLPVSKCVHSLSDRRLPSSERQTACDGVTSTTSLEPNMDRDLYEIN
jgi:hypothetical protein